MIRITKRICEFLNGIFTICNRAFLRIPLIIYEIVDDWGWEATNRSNLALNGSRSKSRIFLSEFLSLRDVVAIVRILRPIAYTVMRFLSFISLCILCLLCLFMSFLFFFIYIIFNFFFMLWFMRCPVCVSEKVGHFIFFDNFGKRGPIFIFSPLSSELINGGSLS